jgi:hypothetical protein
MTKTEKLALLREWQDTIENSDKALALLDAAVGPHDGPLRQSIYTMQSVYTRAISMILGDTFSWLEWYACENDMGRQARPSAYGQSIRAIRTLGQLLKLVEYGQ